MENDIRPLIRRPGVRRLVVLVALASLAVTGIVLAVLWHFVGPPSYDALQNSHDYTCWRCLDDVALATSSNGWAVGEEQPYLLHYADGMWEWKPGPTSSSGRGWFLVSVAMVSPDEGWAVGGDIQHFRDGRWTEEMNFGQQTVLLNAVAAASSQEAWAVGGSWYDDFGFIWRYQGGAWSKVYYAPNLDVVSVAAPAVGDAWAVAIRYRSEGHPSGSSLLHYRNGTWIDALDTPIVLGAIAMTSPTDGWATGNDASGAGIFFHYMDGAWKQAAVIPDTTVYNIAMTSANEGWATGGAGDRENALFHYQDGVWSPVADPVLGKVNYLRGIAAPTDGDVWVVALINGNSRTTGVLLHYQDGIWSIVQIPKTPPYDMGLVMGLYADIGFHVFAIVACLWLLVMSFLAPHGSIVQHWLLRMILASIILELIGSLLSVALHLFAESLAINPTTIAAADESFLMVPALIAFVGLGLVFAVVATLQSTHRTSATR